MSIFRALPVLLLGGLLLAGTLPGQAETPADASSDSLTLVRDGRTDYRIMLAQDAPQVVRDAATLMQQSVHQLTGARLEIQRFDATDPPEIGGPLILLGDTEVARENGADPADLLPGGYAVATRGQTLLLAGVDSEGDLTTTNQEVHAGTYIGVARLLTQRAGIHWYLPGETWTHLEKTDHLTLPRLDERVEPDFATRRYGSIGFYTRDPNRKRSDQRVDDLMHWHRRNGGGSGLRGRPSHDVKYAMAPYVENNTYTGKPEWLALVDGQRVIPQTPRDFTNWYRFHVCTSSTEVRQIFIDYVLKEFRENPDQDVVGISMTDGDRYCQCDECTAQDAPGTDSKTDRFMNFFNAVAREVAQEFPDKMVGTYIYAGYVDPPVLEQNRDVADNLLLTLVQNGTVYFSDEEKQRCLTLIQEWAALHDKMVFYSWPAFHGFLGLPINHPDFLVEHLRAMHEHGFLGYNNLFYGNLVSRQPDAYLWDQLLYDVDADVNQLLSNFYSDLYGPAAEPVRQYYDLLADHIQEVNSQRSFERDLYSDSLYGYEDRILDYYRDILPQMQTLVDEAVKAVKNDPQRKPRVETVRLVTRLTALTVRGIELGRKLEADGLSDREQKELDQVRRDYHELLRKHGNTDVLDIEDIQYVPFRLRRDLSRYLLIPRDITKWYSVPYDERPQAQREDLGQVPTP